MNLTACWDLKITGISTELMASRMWSKVCFNLAFCVSLQSLALAGLPAPRFNQTASLHWVNLVRNGASTPVCDKQLNFTLFECQIRDSLSTMTYLDWWVYIWSESISKKTHNKTTQKTPNWNKRSPKVKISFKIAFNTSGSCSREFLTDGWNMWQETDMSFWRTAIQSRKCWIL